MMLATMGKTPLTMGKALLTMDNTPLTMGKTLAIDDGQCLQ
jgi:hypothetical protein